MPPLHRLTHQQRLTLNEDVLQLFVEFCGEYFKFSLYDYEVEAARELLSSIFVWPHDVYVKQARQSGKTETLTLVIRFLIVFLEATIDTPLLCGIASPKGEQAKTDVDRIKKSIALLRRHFQVEDREFNELTVRAYRFDRHVADIFRFSLAPTSNNESKTLNVLVIEESHKCDHQKRADQLDPMLSASNGPTWHFGVGCAVVSDFKRGCDRQFPDSVTLWMDVDRVIADRRKMYKQTDDPTHLDYEKDFERKLRKYGRANPEIRRNYYLEDTVEEGNFVSRERLLSCARGAGVKVPDQELYVGIDWGRESDKTWVTITNAHNDVITWFRYDSIQYEQQIEMMKADIEPYIPRIIAARGDSTGLGDMPMEFLQNHSNLPIGDESHVKFTLQSKNDLYVNFEAAVFRDKGDPQRFSYPADHPLASEFEEQMTALVREYKGDGEYLSVHHPDEPNAKDDAPDSTALSLFASVTGHIGDIL